MTSQRSRFNRANFWSVEPKSPSLVSLSVRDENVPRVSKRSTSLRTAAAGLRKGLSSSHRPNSAQNTFKTLRRGKATSCSSLKVGRTRSRHTDIALDTIQDEEYVDESVGGHDNHPSDHVCSDLFQRQCQSEMALAVASQLHERSAFERPERPAFTTYDSSETVVHSKLVPASPPSLRSSQKRRHSARQLISKVIRGGQKKAPEDREEQLHGTVSRIERWIEQSDDDTNDNVTNEHRSQITISTSFRREPSPILTVSDRVDDPAAVPPQLRPLHIASRGGTRRSMESAPSIAHVCSFARTGAQRKLPLRLRVTADAEVHEAGLASHNSIWSMVQIHAELPQEATGLPPSESIALAIVLDNSRRTTHKDLKKACLDIMALAVSLDEGIDHLGLYCTSSQNLSETCLLSVANPLDLDELQRKLEATPRLFRDGFSMQDAMLQASQALRTLRLRSSASSDPIVVEDILVITSAASELRACLGDTVDGFRIHLMNPGLIPYPSRVRSELMITRDGEKGNVSSPNHESAAVPLLNGWLFDASQCIAGDCVEHGSHTLVDMVKHIRSQGYGGQISNVSISIREGDDAVVEEIRADMSHGVMLPGHVLSVPVRVKIGPILERRSYSSDDSVRCPSRSSMVDAISELEISLGNHLSELFEVQVSYNHSFFPQNTRLEVRESCWLRRDAKWRRRRIFPVQVNANVQKQLALCMAASEDPVEALRDLEEFVPPLSEEFAKFLEALKRRIRRTLHLYGDTSFRPALQRRPIAPRVLSPSPRKPYQSRHRDSQDTDPSYKFPANASATVVRRRIAPSRNEASLDGMEEEARQIWQQIRRTSRPEEGLPWRESGGEGDGGEAEEEEQDARMQSIRVTALKHGRKISSATLRSLAREFRGREVDGAEQDGEECAELDTVD